MLDLKAHIMLQGGQERINKQHAKGKLTARERVDLLFDPGTFVEYNMFVKPRATRFGMDKVDAPADGIVTGHGLINGRRAFVYSQDATVLGGSMGEMHGLKLARMQELALEAGSPHHRPQRLGRRPPSGRTRCFRLRNCILQQRQRFGRNPADFRDNGKLRGRSMLFAGPHRLRHNGRQVEQSLHNGAEGHPAGDGRGGRP